MKNTSKIKLFLYGFLTLLVMTVVFLLSAQDAEHSSELSEGFLRTLIGGFLGRFLPSISAEGVFHDIRKYAHIFEFFCLGITSTLFFCELRGRISAAARLSFLFCFFYACSDEFHQLFVSGRSGQFSDVGVDLIGAVPGVVAVLLCVFGKRYMERRKSR